MAGGLDIDINTDAAWHAPWRESLGRIARRWQDGQPLPDALNAEPGAPVRFVAHTALAAGEAYESHIFRTACCPTREDTHDFFNGLCWLHWPQAKQRLNALQAAQIAARGVRAQRGPVRDAITVFDENGAVLHAPEPIWQALRARDWRRLFVDLRPLWQQAHLKLFGHALLDKLTQPRKAHTAHIWSHPCPESSMVRADGWLAGQLDADRLAAKPFIPLPILGVPGWWAGNQNFSFYDDSLVFRPAARHNQTTTSAPKSSPT